MRNAGMNGDTDLVAAAEFAAIADGGSEVVAAVEFSPRRKTYFRRGRLAPPEPDEIRLAG
jgi:hypothetical protein